MAYRAAPPKLSSAICAPRACNAAAASSSGSGLGLQTIKVDFGDGPVTVTTNPFRADLVASVADAPDFESFMAFPAPVRALMRVPHGGLLRALAARLPEGPSDEQIAKGSSAVHAQARGAGGETVSALLTVPDAYRFTGLTGAACLKRVLAGDAPPGFHTPVQAWGADLPLGLPGVQRRLL